MPNEIQQKTRSDRGRVVMINRKAKAAMMLKGITSKFIAEKYEVSETWVSLVLNNHGMSARIRKAIADAVEMKVEDLWDDEKRRAA